MVWTVATTLLGMLAGALLVWKISVIPLKKRVRILRSVLSQDSAAKMSRILAWEERWRKSIEVQKELASELKWKQARILALESDLERVQSKLMWKE